MPSDKVNYILMAGLFFGWLLLSDIAAIRIGLDYWDRRMFNTITMMLMMIGEVLVLMSKAEEA